MYRPLINNGYALYIIIIYRCAVIYSFVFIYINGVVFLGGSSN